MLLDKIIRKRKDWRYKVRSAYDEGFLRARHEINLQRRLDPELKDVVQDAEQRMRSARFASETDHRYLKAPYVIGTPRANFKGNWMEYVAFRYGEFRALNQLF